MALSKSAQLPANDFIKPKSPYEVVVSGNWRVTDRRHERASSFRIPKKIILSIALIFTVLLSAHTFIVYMSGTPCSLPKEIANRVDFLENRLNFFEDYFGDHALQRSKRSVQPSYQGVESRPVQRNSSAQDVNLDIQAAQFTTTVSGPFTARPFRGVLGPWNEQPSNASKASSFGLNLVEGNRKVEVSRAGIYFIYSQVTYPSSNTVNSYSINLISAGDKKPTPISACHAPVEFSTFEEISCHTSIARALKPRDKIYLELVEPNTSIIKDGKNTHFGIVFLSVL